MYEPFPGPYVWNLAANIALYTGGNHGEVDAACRDAQAAASDGADARTDVFFSSFLKVADQVVANAKLDIEKGWRLSASAKMRRAAIYYQVAERMQERGDPRRPQAYRDGLDCTAQWIELGGLPIEHVDLPYEGSSFPAWFWKAPAKDGKPAPAMVICNGLDSTKEIIMWTGIGRALAERGISVLYVDQPGTGGAIRLNDLRGVHDSERWATPAVDWLEARADVDPKRIGMMGLSLGGYFAPRAAAFEKRFALCAIMGANHDWGELQQRRLQRSGENPVPHYWEHVMWVFGKPDMETFMAWAPSMCLDGVVEKINVPFLVTHSSGDRQIPLEYAHRSYEQAVNSPRREMHVFQPSDYAIEHCEIDNGTVQCDYIADWIAETFGMPTG
jgi:pimeloyl-ACP methyl ester carboxylesterase